MAVMTEPEMLRAAADCLYRRDDPRATPWPPDAELGRMRSLIRTLADQVEAQQDDDKAP